MNNQIIKLLLLFSINIYAQVNVDTLAVKVNYKAYQEKANFEIAKLLEYNSKIKSVTDKNSYYFELYTGEITDLKIIPIPIFNFKKEVKNFKKGENLISYIDFTTDVLNQETVIFYRSNLNSIININDIDYEKIEANYKNDINSIDRMLVKKRNYKDQFTSFYDLLLHFDDKFFFLLLDRLCVVINGDIFVLSNEAGSIKMTIFNFIFNSIDEVKKKTAGSNETNFILDNEYTPLKTKIYLKLEDNVP